MKRAAVTGVVMFVLAGLTACIPAPSPAPNYFPPVLESVSTPAPAHPGTAVSIVLQASDDQAISGVAILGLKTADGSALPGAIPCTSTMDQGADLTRAAITITCLVPSFANNGTWEVQAVLRDDAGDGYSYPGLPIQVPFTVVGGSNDTSPPQLVSFGIDPPELHTLSAFTLTARFSDESGTAVQDGYSSFRINNVLSAYYYMECYYPQVTIVSPTLTDIMWSCTAVSGSTGVGTYHASLGTIDQLGHAGTSEISNINVDY